MTRLHNNQRPRSTPSSTPAGQPDTDQRDPTRAAPFAVEVWQAIPGTPLDMPQDGGVHHIGYWVDNLPAEANRLDVLGYPATPRPAPRRC
jgi:hypothetical protein